MDGPLFQGSRQETQGEAEAAWESQDEGGKTIKVTRWSGLHLRQARQLSLAVFRVEREGAKGSKRDPKISWFVSFNAAIPLEHVASHYKRRFSHEHGYRFLKQDLLWTGVHVRTPEQFERWSVLVAVAFNQLVLARELGQASYRPWEPTARPATTSSSRDGVDFEADWHPSPSVPTTRKIAWPRHRIPSPTGQALCGGHQTPKKGGCCKRLSTHAASIRSRFLIFELF